MFLAFARDPDDAAAGTTGDAAAARLGACERPRWEASTRGRRGAWQLSGTGLVCGAQKERCEIVIGNRIFVLLAEVSLLDEHVDARRKSAGPRFALEQPNRPCVLLASEDELRFFLSLHGLAPHRHGNGHHDGHDAQADQ